MLFLGAARNGLISPKETLPEPGAATDTFGDLRWRPPQADA
jgi:hypothetical protein